MTLVSLDQHLSNLNTLLALQLVSFALILNLNNLVLASLVLALVITGKGPAYMPDQHICMYKIGTLTIILLYNTMQAPTLQVTPVLQQHSS